MRALYIPGSLGEIRTLLSKIIRPGEFQKGTYCLAAFPELQSYRNTAVISAQPRTIAEIIHPEIDCFLIVAAVYDNLDCSDVMDSPHFSIATKLLEVMDSHLFLLVLSFTLVPC